MKRLKKVFELYRLDWHRVYQNKLTLMLIMALMVIPSLYAWFNIAALWDPYSSTGDIKVAIYSEDKRAEVMDKSVNIGDEMLKNLKENDNFSWQFVKSEAELDKGVKSGKYYAGIVIPSDFSKNLVSFVNGDIKKPEIDYRVNQKINAIAPKVTEKGASAIQSTIATQFIDTVSKTVFETLNQAGYKIDEGLPTLNKVTSKILLADEHLDEIDGYTKKITELNDKFPEYKEKLDKANEVVDYLPKVNEVGDKLVELNKKLPELKKVGELVVTLQGKTDQIKEAGKQIKTIDEEFDKIVETLNKAVDTSKKGLKIIGEAQEMLPDVQRFVDQANGTLPTVIDEVGKIQTALPQIGDGLTSGLNVVVLVAQNVMTTTDNLNAFLDKTELDDETRAAIKQVLVVLQTQSAKLDQMITNVINTLNKLMALAGDNSLQPVVDRLKNIQTAGQGLNQFVTSVVNGFDSMNTEEIKDSISKINQIAGEIGSHATNLEGELPSIQTTITGILTNVSAMLDTANNLTHKVDEQNMLAQLDDVMSNTTETINTALKFFDEYQSELPKIKEEIHTANVLLNDNMTTVIDGIDKAASFYQNDLPKLEEKMNQGVAFYQKEWPAIEEELTKTLGTVNEKMPDIEKALTLSTGFINDEWPEVRNGIQKAADLVRKGQNNVDLGSLISLLKKDANDESDFLSNPVKINEQDIYPVPNYGSASAPFYTALCLWVGSVLFSSIATTVVHLDGKQKKRYSMRQQYVSRYMTFITVGLAQAAIVALGNRFLLNAYMVNPGWNFLFTLLISLVFMSMVYALVHLFGNLGKGMAVIILVLSISAGGGNFPIQMSGKFFNMIHPFLPFTYAVNLLRETTGGIYWPNAIKNIIVLAAVGATFAIIGYILAPKVTTIFRKLNAKLKEGHLLH
ncbi:YhgE/Pip domain-containing protein [Vagococcus zengguangii]|uniref:YhgE/Pip domain-containing protein n=1 Tax=Vagococcus zengguangii TaxID=2571750 RepID=A0A4D7CTZ9_9ENTE|nr:YhgE/Pip domain-containing protein [Vagococcus zengguangii]QCI85867.1 YhgE/Pip domain-containing protein [Vagococcus zengguangii]TLG81807.1 YhgE/Pip domain-containing protein [Vagococcus zengguangii]